MSGSTVLKIAGGIAAAIASVIGIEVGWNVLKNTRNPIKITQKSKEAEKMASECQAYAEEHPDWGAKWFED